MTDKSGGDVVQANQGAQANLSAQDLDSVAIAGAGILEGIGGSATSMGVTGQAIQQMQAQGNIASTGSGGDDNVNANTNVNV